MLFQIIISKTPYRLTLGGGGTDLPAYYEKFGGFVMSTALDKYIYLMVKERFQHEIRLSYSITEIKENIEDIAHPIVKEILSMMALRNNLEVISIGDIPSGTGLGSSGSFTVGLLNALYAYRNESVSRVKLAEMACLVEMEKLKGPSGKQDPYIASFGGFTCLHIKKNGTVKVSRLSLTPEISKELENNLMFFYTGFRRDASKILEEQKKVIKVNKEQALGSMHKIKEIGLKIKKALERADLNEFGRLQNDHWIAKKAISSKMSNKIIDRWYKLAMNNGAIGGKLMGAGGGGFLMFYIEDSNQQQKLRNIFAKEKIREVMFGLGAEGTKIMLNV